VEIILKVISLRSFSEAKDVQRLDQSEGRYPDKKPLLNANDFPTGEAGFARRIGPLQIGDEDAG